MEIEKLTTKVKCDASGCNNMSEYKIVNKRFVFNGCFYFCPTCLNELYNLIGQYITPKSPNPIFKSKGVKKNEQN